MYDSWGHENHVKVMFLEETKINQNKTVETDHYIWYFGTGVPIETVDKIRKLKESKTPIPDELRLSSTEHWGTGFAIHKSIVPALDQIFVINKRISLAVFDFKTKFVCLAAYAPTAEASEQDKETFYNDLDKVLQDIPNEAILVIGGDFNARIIYRNEHLTEHIGEHFLKSDENEVNNISPQVKDNRIRFFNFLQKQDLWVANTHFQKHQKHYCTFKPPTTIRTGENWTYGQFFQYDYFLIKQRWKNICKNAETDVDMISGSDHYSLWCTLEVKFAKPKKPTNKQIKYELKIDQTTKQAFNNSFKQAIENVNTNNENGHITIDEALNKAAVTLTEKSPKIKKPWITQETYELIKQKHWLQQYGQKEAAETTAKQVKKMINKNWNDWLKNITESELDIRDKWLGIKFIKTTHKAKLYERKNRQGELVTFKQQAEAAADYLEKDQWGIQTEQREERETSRLHIKRNKFENHYNTANFTVQEIKCLIKILKRNKATGPDEIPMEFYKWLNEENLEKVADLINYWWNNNYFPAEKLEAYIASIYKKGDPKNQANYRPISLLTSIYKIYTSLIQKRLAAAIDNDLQETQYGFRKARSTVIPLACIRRIMEKAEATKHPLFLVFLDWEKAFDQIEQPKLIESLYRMNVDEKYINAIKNLYNHPKFAVKIGNHKSNWKTQDRGIRQGCPLSPYLFLIVMTVMFRDIHDGLNLTRGTLEHINFTELLYADDTALITSNKNAMNRLIARIEKHANYFGLNFNKGKCVAMVYNAAGTPIFDDGTKLQTPENTPYLGANISRNHDTKLEVSKKVTECFIILNKLQVFWKKSTCPTKFKLQVFDAVIRSKLVYSLNVTQLPQHLMNRLNTFQLKGLRKILNLKTTFVERSNTNNKVFQEANQIKNPNNVPNKNILTFETYIRNTQEALYKHIVRLPNSDPVRQCTLEPNSAIPHIHTNRRVGRPRIRWENDIASRIFTKNHLGTYQQFTQNTEECYNLMEPLIRNRTI